MWICTNKGFISVVAFRGRAEHLLVRGRLPGDIEAIFPEAEVIEGAGSDYRFRTTVTRERFQEVLAGLADEIGYTNFKDSVRDEDLHGMYLEFWQAAYDVQERVKHDGR